MSKSRGIYSLRVEYDKEWENITERVVIFKRLVDGLILAIKDSTGEVAVPWEVTDKISQVEIGVIGYNDNHEKIISTTAISGGNMILIAQATPNNGVEPLAPSPDIWNQIRGDIESLKSKTTQIEDTLNNKVDRDGSKVLSTNDYTDEDKDKLAGIEHGAEKNVQSDWNQTDDTADDYIKHKPDNIVQDGSYNHTDNNYTDQDKLKLRDIEARAEVNKIDKVSDHSGRPLTITDKGVKLPDFALRSEITSVYRMKGSLSNLAAIQSVVDKEIGDVYNAEDSGMNYVWNGSIWDALGSSVDLSVYYTKGESDDRYVQKESGKVLSSNDYTTNEKNKLAGIEEKAQKNPPIDTTLSETSKNAVENKVITTEMNKKAEKTDVEENASIISDILNALSKESDKGTNFKLNTSATKVLWINIYGNTEQKKYTGKNIIDNLTFTTLFGTRTNTATGTIVKRGDSQKPVIGVYSIRQGADLKMWNHIISQTDLVLSFSVRSLTNQKLNFSYRLEPLPYNNIQLTTSWQKVVYKVQKSNARDFTAFIFYASNLDMTDPNCGFEIKDVQIEAGTEATDYEPFVGSTLPNGFSNLFDEFSNLPLSRDGVTLSDQNGVLKLTGQPTADWIPLTSRNITSFLQDKQTYTVFQPNVYGVKLYPEVIAQRKDGGKSMSWNGQYNRTFTFTVDFDTYSSYSMKLQMGPKSAYPEPITFYNNYALFVGSYTLETIPEYSPYNTPLVSPRPQLPQVVKELSGSKVKVISKNLLKVKNLTSTQAQAVVVVNPDNSITVSDENKNNWGMNITNDEACPRIEQGTKVTMSIDRPLPYKLILSCWANTGGQSFQFPLAIIDAGSTSVTNVAKYTALSGHLLFSLSEIGKKINETFKVQLEYGDIATPFVPHESSEFTIPSNLNIYKLTNDIYDEVKLENGVAKMIKRVGKLELSGKEADLFLYKNTVSGMIGFSYDAKSYIFNQSKLIPDIICSHFNSINEGDTWHGLLNSSGVSIFAGRENFPLSTKKIVFWFSLADASNLKITDLASFKNWIKAEKTKDTPVTVYYEMRDYIEEEIADPILLSELKKLMEMRTYQDVTNISITSTGVTPEIKVKYMADFKKLLG